MTEADRTCPKCGYVLEPWERECSRCAWQAKQPCQQCGRIGIIGECGRCKKDLCEACAVRERGELRCPDCAEEAPRTAAPVVPIASTGRVASLRGDGRPDLAYPVRASVGWWDSVVRAFAFMRASMALMFRDKDLLLPSVFSLVASVVIIGATALVLWQTGLWDRLGEDNREISWPLAVLGVGLSLVLYITTYFFTAMTVHLVDVALRGRDAKLGKAFRDACKNFLAILSLAVISTLVSLITGAIRRRSRGGLGGLAAGAIDKAWTVATFLLLPIIILEDVPLKRAAQRARVLHTRQFLPIAVGEVAVSMVMGVITMVAVMAAVFGSIAIFRSLGVEAGILAVAGAAMFLAFVMAFTHYVRTAYYTCLYLWAVAREEVGEQAAVPAPLAEALAA